MVSYTRGIKNALSSSAGFTRARTLWACPPGTVAVDSSNTAGMRAWGRDAQYERSESCRTKATLARCAFTLHSRQVGTGQG